MPLETYHHISSERGLSSVTTLIVGTSQCVLIDPPFLIADAQSVVSFITQHSNSKSLFAVFVTHHHPDHYFSANPILEAHPSAKFYSAQYVLDGINREYDEKVKFWPTVFGKENVPVSPRKPEAYPYSFFVLDGDEGSPICLLGPVQGDSIDHTLFWMPTERTIVTGDAVYARSTHAWVEEIETPAILHAWYLTLDLIDALNPTKIITGHIEQGWELNAKEDLAYMRRYLDLFSSKITNAKTKPSVDELYQTFQKAFPQCEKNLDFFLGHLSNQFGEGGKVWEENRHHDVGSRTKGQLEGWCFGMGK